MHGVVSGGVTGFAVTDSSPGAAAGRLGLSKRRAATSLSGTPLHSRLPPHVPVSRPINASARARRRVSPAMPLARELLASREAERVFVADKADDAPRHRGEDAGQKAAEEPLHASRLAHHV